MRFTTVWVDGDLILMHAVHEKGTRTHQSAPATDPESWR